MSNNRIVGVLGILGAVLMSPSAAAQSAGDLDFKNLPRVLSSSAVTREQYIYNILNGFRRLAGEDQVLDRSDVSLQDQRNMARSRARVISQLFRHDLDGDGKVTRKEIEASLGFNVSNSRYKDRQLKKIMQADQNGDEMISIREALDHAGKSRKQRRGRKSRLTTQAQYLSVDPNGDGKVTANELEAVARRVFSHYDMDGNGLLSDKEKARWQGARRNSRRVSRSIKLDQTVATCTLPKPGTRAKIVLLGAHEAGVLSSTSVVGLNRVTQTSGFHIEPGSAPIYIVASSQTANIWRFTGDVSRVERVVTFARRYVEDTAGVGVVGIARNRITFLEPGACARGFPRENSAARLQVLSVLENALGRPVDRVVAAYRLPSALLPSGKRPKVQKLKRVLSGEERKAGLKQLRDSYSNGSGGLIQHYGKRIRLSDVSRGARSFPGGVVQVKAVDVVVPKKTRAVAYDVLPQKPGLEQLIREKKVERLSDDVYLIKKPIPRFPAGMTGGRYYQFMLAKGVPVPEGRPGRSCVLSEETGRAVEGFGRRCR